MIDISLKDKEKIISEHGKNGVEFYNSVYSKLKKYSREWSLDKFELIESPALNTLFSCNSEKYGTSVLKLGRADKEFFTALEFYKLYSGRKVCELHDYNKDDAVILMERVTPGRELMDIKDPLERANIFLEVYKGLHIPCEDTSVFPKYVDWIDRILGYMSGIREQYGEMYEYMAEAAILCHMLTKVYNRKFLLHGDFHQFNILKNSSGGYTVIDPKGVIGDPVFDLPRFILNEFGDVINKDTYERVKSVISIFNKELDIPIIILGQLLFVETVMGCCWEIEDGLINSTYQEICETCRFAHNIMTETTK